MPAPRRPAPHQPHQPHQHDAYRNWNVADASGEPYVGRSLHTLLKNGPGGVVEECYFDFVYQPMQDGRGQAEGSVAARSAGPGYGSSFEIRVRLMADEAPQAGRQNAAPADGRRHPGALTILLVDAIADVRESLAALLRQQGHAADRVERLRRQGRAWTIGRSRFQRAPDQAGRLAAA